MKHLTKTSNPSEVRAQLQGYMLALLLAAFIAALHAGILFGLADLLSLLRQWAKMAMAERPADVFVVITAICSLFATHLGETRGLGGLFLEVGSPALVRR